MSKYLLISAFSVAITGSAGFSAQADAGDFNATVRSIWTGATSAQGRSERQTSSAQAPSEVFSVRDHWTGGAERLASPAARSSVVSASDSAGEFAAFVRSHWTGTPSAEVQGYSVARRTVGDAVKGAEDATGARRVSE